MCLQASDKKVDVDNFAEMSSQTLRSIIPLDRLKEVKEDFQEWNRLLINNSYYTKDYASNIGLNDSKCMSYKFVYDESQPTYEVEFESNNLSAGVYYYTIVTNNFVQTKKMILLK